MDTEHVSRRRLRNTGLTGKPVKRSAAELVAWHGAMQAQDYGPAKWSVGRRSSTVTDREIDDALADASIIRTHVMRETWHFVARADIRWLLELTGPRVLRGGAGRFRQLGLDARTFSRAERILTRELSGTDLTRRELAGIFGAERLDVQGQRLPHLLLQAELVGLICSSGPRGKQHTYALLDEQVPEVAPFDRDEAVIELTRRYLASHGPASVEDLRWWSGLTGADIRKALDALGDEVRKEETDGFTLWSMASESRRAPTAKGALLLHTYDELAVGYTATRYLGDPRTEDAREAWRQRGPSAPLLVDGMIVGHWRRFAGTPMKLEIHLYERLPKSAMDAVEREVGRLARFTGREPNFELFAL